MGKIISNCDLGENESAEQTERLMSLVGAANICCGAHAGSLEKTRATLELAKHFGVMVGAHPGLSADGGRGAALPTVAELDALLQEQLGSFLCIAAEVEVSVSYVKLHGSLYHAIEADPALAEVFLERIKKLDTELGVFCLAGGTFSEVARSAGVKVWEELFADRGYLEDGCLMPRGQEGAVIENVSEAVERLCAWLATGAMPTGEGGSIALNAQTVCVHSDSPNALQLLEALRSYLG
jgi:UPF0271 protein